MGIILAHVRRNSIYTGFSARSEAIFHDGDPLNHLILLALSRRPGSKFKSVAKYNVTSITLHTARGVCKSLFSQAFENHGSTDSTGLRFQLTRHLASVTVIFNQ